MRDVDVDSCLRLNGGWMDGETDGWMDEWISGWDVDSTSTFLSICSSLLCLLAKDKSRSPQGLSPPFF